MMSDEPRFADQTKRPSSARRVRSGQMKLRASHTERAEMIAAAHAAGLELGAYLRTRALAPLDGSGADPASEGRAYILPFRVSPAEQIQIEESAQRGGLTVGAYVRARALRKPVTLSRKQPHVDRAALAQLLAQLGRLNGNINQIARAINYRQHPDLYELRDVPALIENLGREIMVALGKDPNAPRRGGARKAAA